MKQVKLKNFRSSVLNRETEGEIPEQAGETFFFLCIAKNQVSEIGKFLGVDGVARRNGTSYSNVCL